MQTQEIYLPDVPKVIFSDQNIASAVERHIAHRADFQAGRAHTAWGLSDGVHTEKNHQ